MDHYEVSVERRIYASPERIYNLIIDMEEHRRILPKQFETLEVLEGGKRGRYGVPSNHECAGFPLVTDHDPFRTRTGPNRTGTRQIRGRYHHLGAVRSPRVNAYRSSPPNFLKSRVSPAGWSDSSLLL